MGVRDDSDGLAESEGGLAPCPYSRCNCDWYGLLADKTKAAARKTARR